MSRRVAFDNGKLFAALDTIRRYRRMSWRDLAREADVHSSLLTRLAQGHNPDVDNLVRLLTWGGLSLDQFVTAPSEPSGEGTAFVQCESGIHSIEAGTQCPLCAVVGGSRPIDLMANLKASVERARADRAAREPSGEKGGQG